MKHKIGRPYLSVLLFLLVLSTMRVIVADPVEPRPRTLILGDRIITVSDYGRRAQSDSDTPKIALVLSGGGARGFAHIPVIEAIERVGIPIDMVLGTSMGSLVGGLYAAGYSPGDMRRLITAYDMVDMFAISALPPLKTEPLPLRRDRDNLFVLGFDSGGLGVASGIVGDQRILHMLNDSLSRVAGVAHFDDLAIPFRCIGTDLATGERVIFSEGSLVTAIRSSISIPLVFTPYPVEDRLLVDGGLVDNMPVGLARELGADIVIAVDVNTVDYDVSNEELESLTAILAQLIVILTKNTVVNQSESADILITPKLEKHGVLSFNNVDEIIAAGEASAAEHTEEIALLADAIAQFRSLEPKNPQRYGPYFSLPDVMVRTVSHRHVGPNYSLSQSFNLDLFSDFIGKPLDSLRKRELSRIFEDLRISGSYATVTYDYTGAELGKAETVWGNLEIQTRRFPRKLSTVSAGVFGSASLSFDSEQQPRFYFAPDFSLRYTRFELFDSPTTLSVRVANDDALSVESNIRYEVVPKIDFGVALRYVTGGIHPLNMRVVEEKIDMRDRMITSELSMQFRPSTPALIRLAGNLDYIWYGETSIGHEALIGLVKLEGVYTTMPYRFFPSSGMKFEYSAAAEVTDPFGYRLEARFQRVFPVRAQDVLLFDLHAGTSHISNPRRGSYFDYGGSRSIPSYPTHTLVDDLLMARVKHMHWVKQTFPQIVVQSMVTVSSRGDRVLDFLSLADPYAPNRGRPFSSLQEVEFSGSLALGLAFENLDILFGVAVDNALRVSLYLEVL
jgi:NTE family protein